MVQNKYPQVVTGRKVFNVLIIQLVLIVVGLITDLLLRLKRVVFLNQLRKNAALTLLIHINMKTGTGIVILIKKRQTFAIRVLPV